RWEGPDSSGSLTIRQTDRLRRISSPSCVRISFASCSVIVPENWKPSTLSWLASSCRYILSPRALRDPAVAGTSVTRQASAASGGRKQRRSRRARTAEGTDGIGCEVDRNRPTSDRAVQVFLVL